jgi:hypothetical protein
LKRTSLCLAATLLSAPLALTAQTTTAPSQAEVQPTYMEPSTRVAAVQIVPRKKVPPPRPLSRIAVGVGVSTLGPQMQVATNLNSHFNLRGTGNFFTYSTTFTENGIPATANMNLASAGASLDFYPFHHGLRISPGALFYNQNRVSALAPIAGGSSFTFNGNTYYSASANSITGATPLTGTGSLGLHTTKPALTGTLGWGNMIPYSGGHWSFPFEVGAAFIGTPALNLNFAGWVCLDQAQTMCYDFVTDPNAAGARTDLAAQITKWQKDVNPFKTYPIVSFGVAYNFKIRKDAVR